MLFFFAINFGFFRLVKIYWRDRKFLLKDVKLIARSNIVYTLVCNSLKNAEP